jgi:translocation and assembly module TamB
VRRRAPIRRLLLILAALLVLLVIAVPAAVIYYAAFTESGLKLIVSWIPRRIGDVGVQIVNVKGTIAHGIRADRVEVDERLVRVRVEGIAGRVMLAPLLWQTVRSPDTSIRQVTVEVKPHPKAASKRSTPMFLPRWLVISLEHAHIGTGVIVEAGGARLTGTDIVSSAVLRHRTIRFFEAQLQFAETHLSAIGTLHAANPLKLDIDGRIHFTPRTQPAWLFAGTARGDLNSLEIVGRTILPFRSDFSGRALSLTNSKWRWLGNATVHDLDLATWHVGGHLGVIPGELHLQGNQEGFSAYGTATPQGLKAGVFDVGFEGTYAEHVLTARHMEVRHRGSGALAIGSGTFGVVKNGPQLDLHGSWRDLRWPLQAESAPFHSSAAEFTITGILPYRVRAQGMAKAGQLPEMATQIDGILGRQGFKLLDGQVDLFGGHASVTGAVSFSPTQSWSVAGQVEDVGPAIFGIAQPGKLSFRVAAEAHSFAKQADLSVDIRDLAGRVRGVPASGSGSFARMEQGWLFENVRLALGGTHIALDGRLAQPLNLRFSVDASDLSLIAPESRGNLRANGVLRGSLESPVINAAIHGAGIHHEGLTLEELDAALDFDPHPLHESKVDIHVRNLKYHQRTLERLSLELSGRPESYLLKAEARAIGLDATARAVGPYYHGVFSGELEALTVHSKKSLRLDLTKPVGLRLAGSHVRVEWLCLSGKPASLCADGEWTPAQWSTTFTASELPIETLTSGSASPVSYQGTIKVLARLFATAEEPVQGTLRAELTNAQLSHTLLSQRVEHTTIGSGIITATATKTALSATANLLDGQIGTLRAKLVALRSTPEWGDMPLQGELHAQTTQLGLISLYFPDIDRASGRLTADARIGGTLGTPYLGGQLQIADAEVDLYQVNLRLRQLGLTAQLTDNGIDFRGAAGIGAGTANATGRLEWRDSLPHGKLTLHGSNLRLVDVPEAHIDASPELQFAIDGRRVEVTGTVDVPYAKIMPRDLTGAVRTSPDEVLIGSQAQDAAKRFEVLSAINLRLGEKVSIVTSGLTARLKGNIAVKSGYDPITRATGELSIADGKYAAYAHNFDIQRGTLIFNGGPVDNPGIDIRAARKFPAVTAGVNVRGTLLQPRISFFSEPSLPQSQIVSLILSGGSLESALNRDHAGGAGNEALVQGGAVLLQELSSQLGIEDVGVQSSPYITNDTSLVLGKFLSPRLYVSYGVGLTEQLQVLKLRYSLGDHWTVQTEVGQARGADLEFSIDR